MSNSPVLTAPTAPTTLDQLEAALKSLLSSGPTPTIDLSHLGTQFPGLTPVLRRLPGVPSAITDATLVLDESAKTLTLAGTLTLLSAPFAISAVCSIVGTKPQFVLTGTQGTTPLTLLSLAEHLGHHAPHTPDVSLTGLSLALGTDTGDFALSGGANWAIPFGATPSVSVAAQVAFTSSTANITGTLVIATQTFTIACNLAKNADVLTAAWTNHAQPLGWESLVEAAGVTRSDLPQGFEGPTFSTLELTLDFSDHSLTFLAEVAVSSSSTTGSSASTTSSTPPVTEAFLIIKRAPDWGFVIGVYKPADFTLGQLSGNLSKADFVSFQNAFLIASTYDDPAFVLPVDTTIANCPPPAPAFAISHGLNFGAEIDITADAAPMKNLHALTGPKSAIHISAAISFPDSITLSASLGNSLTIPKTNVQLTSPVLNVSLTPAKFDVSVELGLIIPIGTGQAPLVLDGTLDLNDTQASFTANAAADYKLPIPFALHGVVLQDVGATFAITFENAALTLGVEAGFALGGSLQPGEKLALEVAISPAPPWVDPMYFYCLISQPITLPLLVNTVIPEITLPTFFNNFILSNLLLQYSASLSPLKLPDGTLLNQGYQFKGTVNVFSFEMSATLSADYAAGSTKGSANASGISGSFDMSAITLPSAAITAAEQTGAAVSGMLGSNIGGSLGRELKPLDQLARSIPTLVSITGMTAPGPSFAFSAATGSVRSLMKSGAVEAAHGQASASSMQAISLFGGGQFMAPTGASGSSDGGPLVSGQAKVIILGAVGAEVFLNLDVTGLVFAIGVKAGSSVASLSCTFLNKTLTGHCVLAFRINASFDLYVPATKEYIGKIAIDADFNGALGLTVGESGAALTVAGNFDGHTLPGGTFSVPADALKDAAVTVIQRIRDQADQVFKDVTGDANKWANLVKSGAISGADTAIHDANSSFGKAYSGMQQAGQDLKDKATQGVQDIKDEAKHLF